MTEIGYVALLLALVFSGYIALAAYLAGRNGRPDLMDSARRGAYVSLGLVSGWMVWIVIIRDFLITGLRSYAEYHDRPIVTTKGAQAKTFGEFVVIYYILILYVARNTPSVYQEFGPTIDSLMDSHVLFGMMLLVTLSTVGTGIAYLFDNRTLLLEISEQFRTRRRG